MPSMPGSGTCTPLVVLVVPPVLEVEVLVEDEVLELVEELVLDEVEVLPVQFFLQ
jgi:hypothetical protein